LASAGTATPQILSELAWKTYLANQQDAEWMNEYHQALAYAIDRA
jgi:hypothetical protein